MFQKLVRWLSDRLAHSWVILANESGAVPSSLTDDYDAVLTSTLRAMQPRLRDNITRSNKFLAWLEANGRFRMQDGGERVQVALMYAQNNTADIYSAYGILNTAPQDGITSAFYTWSQLSVSIAISRKEERQNSGRSRLLDLLQSKTQQAEVSIKELLNNCVTSGQITATATLGQFTARTGSMDSGALGPLPLAALIDATNTRSVSIGNINGNTYSFWRNKAKSSTATTFAGLKLELNNIYNQCAQGVGGAPDLIVCDQKGWETYWGALTVNDRYVKEDKRTVDILGGSEALAFRGSVMVWDEVVPDAQTNASVVDGIGTVTTSNYYLINSEAMEFVTDSQTDFITTPFVRPENQDAKVAQILWMGALGTNNRRKNGVLYNVSQSITA